MYTKGPWFVNEAGRRWWVESVSGNQITPSCDYENENDHDDARLMAAAPELLEALKKLEWSQVSDDATRLYCPACCREDAVGHADDCYLALVIAKAEGK